MPSPLAYQSFCPAGAALNVVGERWALLVVRDLLLGPRRYSELLSGLGGIGTDILAARLRTLQEHGVVRQVGAGRSQRYELTESGRALQPVLRELSRWGADRLRLPADPSQIPTRVPLTSLLIGATGLPRQANGVYEVRVDDEAVHVEVTAGQVHAAPDREPNTTIEQKPVRENQQTIRPAEGRRLRGAPGRCRDDNAQVDPRPRSARVSVFDSPEQWLGYRSRP